MEGVGRDYELCGLDNRSETMDCGRICLNIEFVVARAVAFVGCRGREERVLEEVY